MQHFLTSPGQLRERIAKILISPQQLKLGPHFSFQAIHLVPQDGGLRQNLLFLLRNKKRNVGGAAKILVDIKQTRNVCTSITILSVHNFPAFPT